MYRNVLVFLWVSTLGLNTAYAEKITQKSAPQKNDGALKFSVDDLAYQDMPAITSKTFRYRSYIRNENSGGELLFPRQCKPEYPRASLRNEETGTVTVSYEVSKTGTIGKIVLVRSSGFSRLDRAVIDEVSRCALRPVLVNGLPVHSSMLTNYVWRLE